MKNGVGHMIKAIFFDWGDTLSDSSVFLPDAARSVFELIRPDVPGEELDSLWRRTWEGIGWERLNGLSPQMAGEKVVREFCAGISTAFSLGSEEEGLARMSRAFLRGIAESESLFPDVIPTLSHLSSAGYRLGIISNNMVEFVGPCLDHLGIRRYFDQVVVSGELGVGKPSPEIFAYALDRMRLKASEAAMVGDSPDADVAGAAGAGMRAVWVRRNGRTLCPEVRPDYVVRQIGELERLSSQWSMDGLTARTESW